MWLSNSGQMTTTVIAKDNNNSFETTSDLLSFVSKVELTSSIEHFVSSWETLDYLSELYWIDKKWIIYSNVWNLIDHLNYDENDSIELKEWETILIPHREWIAYKVVQWDDMTKILQDFWMSKELYLEINWTLEIHPDQIVLIPTPRFIDQEIVYWPKATRFWRGQCTFHVSQKVPWINWWGNAKHWINNAKKLGHTIWHKPIKWAIVQFSWRGMPLWHVWYVEEVYENWDFKISEMNFKRLWEITYRTIKSNNKTIDWFIYLNEAKQEYLLNNFSQVLSKSNKN